nr:DUF3849 domain-containing protein [uncultured Oscillibacter sp.]
MAAEFPRLYPYSFSKAEELEERPQYEESFYINVECAGAIEQAIRDHSSGDGLRENCAKSVLERYGFKRVNFVLANSVKQHKNPELISEDARRWCGKTCVPLDRFVRYFKVNADAPLLEAFILQTRQAYQALGLFDAGHCAGDRHEQDYEDKVLVLSPEALRESCWTPQNQLWYAHDGFGCRPSAIGRSIRATCLGDGEMARWNRSDFIGALDGQYLPDWAEEKLAELHGPEQKQPDGPTMGRMTMEGGVL